MSGQGGSGPALHAPAAAPALALAPTATVPAQAPPALAPAEAAVPARDTSPPTYAAPIAPAPSNTATPTPTEATRPTHVLGATTATLSPAVDLPFHLTMLTSTIRDLQGTRIRDLRHIVHVNHPHVLSILLSTISLELYIQLKRLPPLSIGSLRPNYQWLHALGHLSLALNYILTMNMR